MEKEEISELVHKICETISLYEPFSLEEVKLAYLELRSFDDLLETIEIASDYQESLLETIKNRRDPRGSIREILNRRAFKPQPDNLDNSELERREYRSRRSKATIETGFTIQVRK